MRPKTLLALTLLGANPHAIAGTDSWPTHYRFDDGTEAGVKGNFQYDVNRFGHDRLADGSHRFDDARTWRRQVLELHVLKKGVVEINAGYDFQSNTWQDDYVAATTGIGRFRLGQFKTPVGWEDGNTSSGATTFLETSLAEQAVHEGRRVGLEWTYAALPRWFLQLAWFGRHNLNDDADGATAAARVVFQPVLQDREVLHLGLSASREARDDRNGRERARPEVGLTGIRLVDTGNLPGVDHIDRRGLEAAWMKNAWLLQGEYLTFDAHRPTGPSYRSDGYYVSSSWLLTGESRPYRNSAFANPKPAHDWGALELALRYSTLDLDDRDVHGGRQHDWTLGLNWYLSGHLKLQANYIRAFSSRSQLNLDPEIFALRAQLSF